MRKRALLLAALGAAAAVVPVAVSGASDGPHARVADICSKERWPVKTLSDSRVGMVNFRPKTTTISALRKLRGPEVHDSTPRMRGSIETQTYTVKARLVEIALSSNDRDVKLVIADPRNSRYRMMTEFPDTTCDGASSSPKRDAMAAARAAIIRRFGMPSSDWRMISGTATITGIGFIDDAHPMEGSVSVAKFVELHPVLSFR
jgi:hypothetical protein